MKNFDGLFLVVVYLVLIKSSEVYQCKLIKVKMIGMVMIFKIVEMFIRVMVGLGLLWILSENKMMILVIG